MSGDLFFLCRTSIENYVFIGADWARGLFVFSWVRRKIARMFDDIFGVSIVNTKLLSVIRDFDNTSRKPHL